MSSAAARLLLGFFPQQVVVQTGNVRRDVLMLYICAISLYYCVRARVCFQDSVFSGHETHKRVTNTQATFIKGVKMIRFS